VAVRLLLMVAFALLYGCGQSSSSGKLDNELTTPTIPQTAPSMPNPSTSAAAPTGASASAAMSGSGEQAEQSEADCRLVFYVAERNMSRQEVKAFSELLADMIRTMENPSWSAGSLRNAALDHLGVPQYSGCKQQHTQQTNNITLTMRPIDGSGVSGGATFCDVDEGVAIKLALHNLPKPNVLYLAHVHSGTCTQGEAQSEEKDEHHHGEHAGSTGQEIEWPLSEVRTDAHGNGSSTTTLEHTSMEELFSGPLKHVNVHAVGSGDPPVLTCADLKR
jgi:hypothetical protein